MSPALIVPDQASWTMWGRDPGAMGFTPAATPEQATQMLVPDPVPDSLAEAVRAAWERMPPPRSYVSWARQLPGVPASELLSDEGPGEPGAGHDDEDDSEDEDGGDHGGEDHDMMAIVGDPSADGLVMESIDFELGPLAAALPGGLVLELSLDGDVVERCDARATLTMPLGPIAAGAFGDPSAPASWAAAAALASERAAGTPVTEAAARIRLAAVETERALSHLSWLRAFGFVLGWPELAERANRAAGAVLPARMALQQTAALGRSEEPEKTAALLQTARAPAGRLLSLVDGSRRLRSRTRRCAEIPRDLLAGSGVGGPVARAAGAGADARGGDPLYEALGFREHTLAEGDAEARTLLRAFETETALDLAAAALAQEGSPEPMQSGRSPEPVMEGPRGPVRATSAHGRLKIGAPGAAALLGLAGGAVRGLELGSALVGIASFDLSAWTVSE